MRMTSIAALLFAVRAAAVSLAPLPASAPVEPVQVATCGDGRAFIVDRRGVVLALEGGLPVATPLLDLSARVDATGEGGLLGLAFHPDFLVADAPGEGLLWVFFTESDDSVLARFSVPRGGTSVDPASERVLLRLGRGPRHHGGQVLFAPAPAGEPRLLVSVGDGGVPSSAEDLFDVHGKILRLVPALDAVADTPWLVPPENPRPNEIGEDALIWASGLRNPWRCAIDAARGELVIGDAGESAIEEIDRVSLDAEAPDFGWPRAEGSLCLQPPCDGLPPLFEYDRALVPSGCAVIGGTVARGGRTPWLAGQHVFADHCAGWIFAMDEVAPGDWSVRRLLASGRSVTGFGEDADGSTLVTSFATTGAVVHALDGAPDPIGLLTESIPALGPERLSAKLLASGGSEGPFWTASRPWPAGVTLSPAGEIRATGPSFAPHVTRLTATDSAGSVFEAGACVAHAGWPVTLERARSAPEREIAADSVHVVRDEIVVDDVALRVVLDVTTPGTFDAILSRGAQNGSAPQVIAEVGLRELLLEGASLATAFDGLPATGEWVFIPSPGSTLDAEIVRWSIVLDGHPASCSDLDGDGIPSVTDACNAFADPDQADADGNGLGDACESVTWGDVVPRGAPDGGVDIGDVVWILRAVVGLETPTADELRRADVAPATGDPLRPTPGPTHSLDIADAVLALRVAVGLHALGWPQ